MCSQLLSNAPRLTSNRSWNPKIKPVIPTQSVIKSLDIKSFAIKSLAVSALSSAFSIMAISTSRLTPVAMAAIETGSTLNIASQGIGKIPERKVTIRLQDSNRLVFRSGQTGKLLPLPEDNSQLTFGLGHDRAVNILASTSGFGAAYADATTTIQDLPLNSTGKYQGEIANFIQNIWVKTTDGQRQAVSFNLFSVDYDPRTGQGQISGAFVEADGTESFANGDFAILDTSGCACNYTMQLRVFDLPDGPSSVQPKNNNPGGPNPGGPNGGPSGGPGGTALGLLPLAAIPFLSSGGGGSSSNPPEPVPTPGLIPAAIGFIWKTRRRWKLQQQSNPN